jgi:hypothetical protein
LLHPLIIHQALCFSAFCIQQGLQALSTSDPSVRKQ